MSALTTSLALRAAINVLRDSAESRRMPSGELLDDASVRLHLDAAETEIKSNVVFGKFGLIRRQAVAEPVCCRSPVVRL